MYVSALTVAAYLLVGGFCAVWFWQVIRSTGHRVNVALIVISGLFGLLWPVMMPGVTVYRWMLAHVPDPHHSAAEPVGR